MMSLFEHRKPVATESHRDTLLKLRETLERLKAESEETPRITNLKRILAARIKELESEAA